MQPLERMDPYRDLYDAFSIDEGDIAEFKNDNVGLYGVDCARISCLLFAQLTAVQKHRTLSSVAVTDVIQALEGVGRADCVRGEEPFKHLPLKGFWKAHFFDPSFLVKNLENHWGLRFRSKKFEILCLGVAEMEKKEASFHGWQGRLAHELTIGGYEERAKNKALTGEWLVFSKYADFNYYLCIAQHSGSRGGDEEIYASLKMFCEPEYPFLFANAF